MTDDERSAKGYEHYLSIRKKLDAGATFKAASSAHFFSGQIARFSRRYERTYVSRGQLKWLADINEKGLRKGKKL
jgi:hypothetical protein